MSNILTFTPEEVEANYPAYFKQFPVKAEDTQLGLLFKHHYNHAKQNLRKVFNVDEWGRCKILEVEGHSEDTIKDAMPHTVRALCILAENYIDDTEYEGREIDFVLSNRLPDGAKFSRALLKAVGTNSELAARIIGKRDLCLELPRLPLTGKTDLALVLQNFYSELAEMKKSKYTLYFTLNPYDIVNASNTNGKFSSCNSLGGMYETAPFSALASTTMCMFRLENEKSELVGRCWVSVNADLRSVIVQPAYGFLQMELIQAALTWLVGRLDKRLGPSTWRKWNGDLPPSARDFASRDSTAQFYTDRHIYVLVRDDIEDIPTMDLGDVHCTVCGTLSAHLMCQECSEKLFKYCGYCSGRMLASESSDFCTKCSPYYEMCSKCGLSCARKGRLCGNCVHKTVSCLICGGTHQIDIEKTKLELDLFYVCGRCRQRTAPVLSRPLQMARAVIQERTSFRRGIAHADTFSATTSYAIAA